MFSIIYKFNKTIFSQTLKFLFTEFLMWKFVEFTNVVLSIHLQLKLLIYFIFFLPFDLFLFLLNFCSIVFLLFFWQPCWFVFIVIADYLFWTILVVFDNCCYSNVFGSWRDETFYWDACNFNIDSVNCWRFFD